MRRSSGSRRAARATAAVVIGGALLVSQKAGAATSVLTVDQAVPSPDLCATNPAAVPGLPAQLPCVVQQRPDGTVIKNPAQYTGTRTQGLSVAAKARQALRIPAAISAAVVPVNQFVKRDQFLPGAPALATAELRFYPRAFFISPAGSDRPYGVLPPVTVRTLAFGAIPVEATINIAQTRAADGTPTPISLFQVSYLIPVASGGQINTDVTGSAEVSVRLSDVSIDGKPVEVGSECATSAPTTIALTGKGPPQGTTAVGSTYYTASSGGRLDGSMTIPSFSGCVTPTGEDLSPLFTGTISGPGNPVLIRQTGSSAFCFPRTDRPASCPALPAPDPINALDGALPQQ